MSIIYTILLFLLPVLYIPIMPFPFELPKVIAVEFLVILLFLIFISQQKIGHIVADNILPIFALTLVFALSLIHIAFYASTTSFFGNPYRLQGILLLWILLLFSFITAYTKVFRFKVVMWLFAELGLLLSAIFLKHPETGRAIGTLGEANALSAASIFLWPFSSLITVKNTKHFKHFFIFLALLVTIFIVFDSGSRAGVIALIIQLVYIFIKKVIKTSYAALGVALFFMLASLLLPFLDTQGVYENRAEIWGTAVSAGFIYPMIGGGFGNLQNTLQEAAHKYSNNIRFQVVDSSHNMFLDWWVQGGIIGFIVILSLTIFTLISFENQKKTLDSTLFLGVVTVLLFNPASIVTLIAFWWLVGLGLKRN